MKPNLPECFVFIATSLDGYIAREDGSLDWLPGSDGTPSEYGDFGFGDFFSGTDTIVMGKNTYNTVLGFPEWPFGDRTAVVLSSSYPNEPEKIRDNVYGTSGPLAGLLSWLYSKGSRKVYVDGGKTIQGFLKEGLLSKITITRVPVLIGKGIPLFGETRKDVPLEHLETKSWANGFVQGTYSFKPQSL